MLRSLAVLVLCAIALSAHAHHPRHHRTTAPDAPFAPAATDTIGGTLQALPVRDLRTGATLHYFSLRQADGSRVAVEGFSGDESADGAQVRLEGRRKGDTFFVERAATLVAADPAVKKTMAAGQRHVGTLEFLHADDFERGSCDLVYSLKSANGDQIPVRFPVTPEILEEGMAIAVDAVPTDDADTVEARSIEIVADAPSKLHVDAKVSGTTQVLVILLKYSDTASDPYTQAQIQGRMFTDANSVANYYKEASYQKHMLAGVVTPWLVARFARPASCLYSQVASEARALAQQAGYNLTSYQKFVYVFPSLPGCGWAGLGGGSQAWINQSASLLVFGHELGHTFGLGHAGSLDCGTQVIGGTCTRSEYGDPYEIMGNARGAHFSAPYKDRLGYFSANQVRTHAGGTTTYTLSPLESPGGTTYAVKVPASAQRTYWIEWRQPIGFDSVVAAGGTNGALVHIAYPTEYGCEVCVLDMTPATSTFGDSAIPTGQSFADATTGTTISVLAQTGTTLTVTVTTPDRVAFVDVPATHPAFDAIEALAWNGVSLGCATTPARFCPDAPVTRAEMATFIERAKRGSGFTFTATGTRFADVPASHWASGFIEQLYTDGITLGCATEPLRYCPDSPITRAQMAPMLLKARYGSTFNAGSASGTLFVDVASSTPFAAWIERVYQYGISLGCTASPRRYCPDSAVTRAQMALFLQRTFNLPSPP